MKITRRRLLKLSLAGGCAGVGLATYACRIEPRWVVIEYAELPVPHLPQSLVGSTCVQLSDLHIGTRVEDSYLREQFERVEDLKPDFVFYTGDFIDRADKEHVERLRKVIPFAPKGRLGTAGVLGNHDFHGDIVDTRIADLVAKELTDQGIPILQDSTIDFGDLKVVGLEDYWSPRFNVQKVQALVESVANTTSPTITLSHNPDTADLGIWKNYTSWILCGHTHGGQCRIPLFGAPYVPVKNKNYIEGSYDLEGGHKMYINRGLGHTLRIRFMARPEVTVFTLKRA